ncbi:MAG: phosphoenolpyruvate carboxykinase [Armatimonadetes bacterium]|nr:phosphoenolpyruvate carboxykinase [Armatimonadota bacterium]
MDIAGEVNDRSVMIYMTGAVCTQPAQVLQAPQAVAVIQNFLNDLRQRQSDLLHVCGQRDTAGDRAHPSDAAQDLARALALLCDLTWQELSVRAPDLGYLVTDPMALARFVEDLYDHWRHYERYLLFEARASETRDRAIEGHRPFIFNNQDLSSLTREAYRRIERNLRGHWPRVYRQVPAGANMSLLLERIAWQNPGGVYAALDPIRMVRLALLVPPVTLYPRRNTRKGRFEQIHEHPLQGVELDPAQWLCIPLLVGELVFHFYFDREYLALAVSLVNLFELAGHDEARRKPDGVVLFGLPAERLGVHPTAFYVDEDENIVVGAVAKSEDVDYFGYCKKMTLTLHNVIMMRRGRLPLHGAMCYLSLRSGQRFSVVIVGDSGAGKSETLEAFRVLADEHISDMTIIFDDMGSVQLTPDGRLLGYGTEIGAFVRLDDLSPGYAFGHFDRSIFMNPHRHNARLVVPLTEYADVVAGYPVDLLLYANNYEDVTESQPAVELFTDAEQALEVFRAGYRAAKGTTDERGLVRTYFANPFGAEQLRDLHEPLARRYFAGAFQAGVKVGQLRTRLGIDGYEIEGPRQAAEALFERIREWYGGE